MERNSAANLYRGNRKYCGCAHQRTIAPDEKFRHGFLNTGTSVHPAGSISTSTSSPTLIDPAWKKSSKSRTSGELHRLMCRHRLSHRQIRCGNRATSAPKLGIHQVKVCDGHLARHWFFVTRVRRDGCASLAGNNMCLQARR